MTRPRTGRRCLLFSCSALGVGALAGCLDETGLDDADESDGESSDIDFPPGLSADGIADASALLEAHRGAVSSASFTVDYACERQGLDDERDAAGPERGSFTIRAEPNAGRIVRTDHESGRSVYIDGDRGAASDASPIDRRSVDDVVSEALGTIDERLLELVDEYDGIRSTDAGPVHEFGVRGVSVQSASDDRLKAEGTVLVDEDGRIHRYRTTQAAEDDDRTTLEIDVEFGGFDETTVEKPDWADDLESTDESEVVIESGARIALDGRTGGWIGVEPAAVEGLENPTLVLEAGERYEIGWSDGDGAMHNIELRDANGAVVDDLSTPITDEPADDQWLEFDASAEITSYVCKPHEEVMVGEIEVR